MKTIFLSLMLVLGPNLHAQNKGIKNLYARFSLTGGSYFGGKVSLDADFCNPLFMSFGYTNQVRRAHDLPNDFQGTAFGIFPTAPLEEINFVYFSTGRYWIFKNSNFRLNANAGIGIATYFYPINFQKLTTPKLFTIENYSYEKQKEDRPGLILNLSIDNIPFRGIGSSLGTTLFVFNDMASFSLDLSLLLGRVNKDATSKYNPFE